MIKVKAKTRWLILLTTLALWLAGVGLNFYFFMRYTGIDCSGYECWKMLRILGFVFNFLIYWLFGLIAGLFIEILLFIKADAHSPSMV